MGWYFQTPEAQGKAAYLIRKHVVGRDGLQRAKEMLRYTSKEDAIAGHERMVSKWKRRK